MKRESGKQKPERRKYAKRIHLRVLAVFNGPWQAKANCIQIKVPTLNEKGKLKSRERGREEQCEENLSSLHE
jgi:hypothetical protein